MILNQGRADFAVFDMGIKKDEKKFWAADGAVCPYLAFPV
jgi:hypothetical protein